MAMPKAQPAVTPLTGDEIVRLIQSGKLVLAKAAELKGAAGKSAYEIAKAAGFAGTEAQWLASLKGAASTIAGPSAFEVAKAAGFSGTQAEWLASLKGAAGKDAPLRQSTVMMTTNGTAVWTFPTPFAAGVIPTPSITVEDATGDLLSAKLLVLNNTTMSVRVLKLAAVLGVLGLSTNANVKLHLSVAAPA